MRWWFLLLFILSWAQTRNVIVQFHMAEEDWATLSATHLKQANTPRHERIAAYRLALMAKVEAIQSNVQTLLRSHNHTAFHMLWITNQLAIANVSSALLDLVAQDVHVDHIMDDELVMPPSDQHYTVHNESRELRTTSGRVWGVDKVEAPIAWKAGIRGQRAVVGIIDTGIYVQHPSIGQERLLAWRDAVHGRKEPYDNDGHGTHVAGTIGGRDGFGVAPETKFVVCKAFDTKLAKNSALAKCGKLLLYKVLPFKTDVQPRSCCVRILRPTAV